MKLSDPRRVLILLLCVSALYLGLVNLAIPIQSENLHSEFHTSTLLQDTLRPEIYQWGLDNPVNAETAFTVWANVSDRDSGIQNVTAFLQQDIDEPISSIMSFNGSFYTTSFAPVESNHTYSVWIQAYDEAGNLATGYARNFDLRIFIDPEIVAGATMPFVISGSLVTLVVAIGLSYQYEKRNPRDEPTADIDDQTENESAEDAI